MGLAPPRLRHKTKVLRDVSLVCAVAGNCVVGMGGLAPSLPRRKTMEDGAGHRAGAFPCAQLGCHSLCVLYKHMHIYIWQYLVS